MFGVVISGIKKRKEQKKKKEEEEEAESIIRSKQVCRFGKLQRKAISADVANCHESLCTCSILPLRYLLLIGVLADERAETI
jgi:hypothetical protein